MKFIEVILFIAMRILLVLVFPGSAETHTR